VVSERTWGEVGKAPAAVRAWLHGVPAEHMQTLDALHRSDARHVAFASRAGVDALASWNFSHMVNERRIRIYHEVNRKMGYPAPEIKSPEELTRDDREPRQIV